jgi:hypothetical protein
MLTGDDAKEFMDKERIRVRQLKEEKLGGAKAEAARHGKESFDLERLESLCDTSHEGRMAPFDERITEYEWKYYVDYPEIMTIEEFARKVDELNRW